MRARRPPRTTRVFQTSNGIVQIQYVGRSLAFATLYDEGGWPARRLVRPLGRAAPAIGKSLRRVGVSGEELADLAERIAAEWPDERPGMVGLLAQGLAVMALALLGAVVVLRMLVRQLIRAASR